MKARLFTPPVYAPTAIPTNKGWVDPKTGEVLVSIKNLLDRMKEENSVSNDEAMVPSIAVEITVEETSAPDVAVEDNSTAEVSEPVEEAAAEETSDDKPKRRSAKRG